MLARATDRHGDVQTGRDLLARLADLPGWRTPARIASGAGRGGLTAQHRREFLQILERLGTTETSASRNDYARVFQPRRARRFGFAFDDLRAVVGLKIEPGPSDRGHRRRVRGHRLERAGAQPYDRGRPLQLDRGYGLAAVDASFDPDRAIPSHQFETIAGGRASQSMRQSRRGLLAVSVVAEQDRARPDVAADLRDRVQMQFRLVADQFSLVGGYYGVGDRRDPDVQLGIVRAGDDGMQPAIELIGQTTPRADDALRGAVVDGAGKQTDNYVAHNFGGCRSQSACDFDDALGEPFDLLLERIAGDELADHFFDRDGQIDDF